MPVNLEKEIVGRERIHEAAARLSAIVEFSDDAIVSKDLHGIVTTWNAGAEKLFGYSAGEMIGRPIARLIPAERQREEVEILDRIRRGESVRHFETERLRKDGRGFAISVTVSPIKDANGKIVGASKVARDITERKQAEAEIRRLNQNLERRVQERTAELARTLTLQQAILSSANYAIISTTPEGIVTTFNATAESWLGYSAAEIIGKVTPEIWHDGCEMAARANVLSQELGQSVKAGFECFVAKVRLGRVDETEWTLIRKDGYRFPATLSATRLLDGAGAITGYLGVLSNISERKRAEKQLKASLREVNDLKTALDEHAVVAVTDPEGRITYANDKFCALSKYSRAELMGQDHRLLNSGFHPKEFMRDLWTTIARGKVWKGEIRNRAKDGTFYWVNATIVPFLGEDGKPRQYVAIRTDISARKQNEAELEKVIAELQEALAEVKTLSGMLPICATCKKIRDDKGYWNRVEEYVTEHTHASFSHGICPDCAKSFREEAEKWLGADNRPPAS